MYNAILVLELSLIILHCLTAIPDFRGVAEYYMRHTSVHII